MIKLDMFPLIFLWLSMILCKSLNHMNSFRMNDELSQNNMALKVLNIQDTCSPVAPFY